MHKHFEVLDSDIHIRNQERWRPFEACGWTSKVQMEAMDMEGIDVAVIYPSRGLGARQR
jgi:hypothetical protein